MLGSINISAGTVQVGNSDANGGLPSGALANNGSLIFDRTDNLALANTMTGSGSLTQNGTGVLIVSGANSSFNGPVSVNQGALQLGANAALGTTNAGTTIANGATAITRGFPLTNIQVTCSGAGVGGVGAITNSGASVFPAVTAMP